LKEKVEKKEKNKNAYSENTVKARKALRPFLSTVSLFLFPSIFLCIIYLLSLFSLSLLQNFGMMTWHLFNNNKELVLMARALGSSKK